MPTASLRQPGASGTLLAHPLLSFTDRATEARSKEEADVLWQKSHLSPESISEKMHLPNSPKKKKKWGEEKVHTPPTRVGRDTHSPSTCLSSAHVIPGQHQKLTSHPTPWVQLELGIAQCQSISL